MVTVCPTREVGMWLLYRCGGVTSGSIVAKALNSMMGIHRWASVGCHSLLCVAEGEKRQERRWEE